MAACLLITLPLEFVFNARVYRRPKRLVLALCPVLLVFFVWDLYAIARGHWDFASQYVTGWRVGSVPVEELAFFVTIPLCAILSFEAIRNITSRRSGRADG